MEKFKVAEHFASINGEGTRAGQLAYFIRFAGCGLSCSYCDTSWANQEDTAFTLMSTSEIYETIRLSGIKNITLTGGEPLMQSNIAELIDVLISDPHLSVEIETNGSIDISPFIPDDESLRPLFTMDYKLPSSEMEILMLVSNFNYLTSQDTVKFVAGNMEDLVRARNVIDAYDLTEKCHVYISPVFGQIEPSEIVDFMKENKMNDVSLQLQLHKLIWNPEERGV